MPAPEGRHTLVGTKLPGGQPSPTLLFHKWQRYDCFVRESYLDHKNNPQDLTPFSREETRYPYLRDVATWVQKAGREYYAAWNRRFSKSCEAVGAAEPVVATTGWRMAVGWATNPALEVGLTLDPLYGFPFVPGAAVKGMLHRVAEEELLGKVPALPEPGEVPPPSEGLAAAVDAALRVRALFGSLHLRADHDGQPVSALMLLERWLAVAQQGVRNEEMRDAWREPLRRLETVCSATGGMLTCFDAVPAADSFSAQSRQLLEVDVLTPHTEGSPIPITFLAVRDGAAFELRYRLAAWPVAEPRDDEERDRGEALAGWSPEVVNKQLHSWLRRGVEELGLGGKTSAGYGYLYESGRLPRPPRLLAEPPVEQVKRPEDDLPPAERDAKKLLPEDILPSRAISYLDAALSRPASAERTALAKRFVELFPEQLEAWEQTMAPTKIKRARRLREALGDGEDGE